MVLIGRGPKNATGLRLVGFEQRDRGLKADAAFAATKLNDVSIHAHFRDVQGFLMAAGTCPQLGTRAFFAPLRVPDDACNGSNGQTMPGFAVHAKDADGVGYGEQFEIQRKGVNGKALLQKCAGLKNVTHTVLPFVAVHSSRSQERDWVRSRENRLPGCELVPVATGQRSVSAHVSRIHRWRILVVSSNVST